MYLKITRTKCFIIKIATKNGIICNQKGRQFSFCLNKFKNKPHGLSFYKGRPVKIISYWHCYLLIHYGSLSARLMRSVMVGLREVTTEILINYSWPIWSHFIYLKNILFENQHIFLTMYRYLKSITKTWIQYICWCLIDKLISNEAL